MTIVAVRSFVGVLPDGRRIHVSEGDELVLPDGVDWLKAGLVIEIPDGPETAAKEGPAEKATKRAPRKRKE